MAWLIIAAVALVTFFLLKQLGLLARPSVYIGKPSHKTVNLAPLPLRFIVLDLETTGLDPARNEIIEIGAVRVNRDSDIHDTFRALVRPVRHIPKRITEINGILQEMVDSDGMSLEQAIREFVTFIGDLPLVTFNAEFGMAFLQNAARRHNVVINNPATCALKMARLAWPGRESYKLSDLSKDGGLSDEGTHHALDDCRRTLIVYVAAVSALGTTGAHVRRVDPKMRVEAISPRMRTFR